MWLDIARISGLFPFCILFGLTISFFWKAIKYALKSGAESAYLILGLNLCFLLRVLLNQYWEELTLCYLVCLGEVRRLGIEDTKCGICVKFRV